MEKKNLVFIGGGNMTETMLLGIIMASNDGSMILNEMEIFVYNVRQERGEYLKQKYHINRIHSPSEGAALADLLILSVRAEDAIEYAKRMKPSMKEGCVFISICADVSLSSFASVLREECKLVRTMPNTLTETGCGYSALCFGSYITSQEEQMVKSIFRLIGKTIVIPETLFPAFTGFSSAGPAFFYYMAAAMIDAGVRCGFSREEARALTVENMIGSGIKMEGENTTHPRGFIDRMTSPKGITIEALHSMEASGLAGSIQKAVEAAIRE